MLTFSHWPCVDVLPDVPLRPAPPAAQFWPLVAHKVVGCQLIMVVFTACVLLFKVGGGRAACFRRCGGRAWLPGAVVLEQVLVATCDALQ